MDDAYTRGLRFAEDRIRSALDRLDKEHEQTKSPVRIMELFGARLALIALGREVLDEEARLLDEAKRQREGV